jgi:hypothetical protein
MISALKANIQATEVLEATTFESFEIFWRAHEDKIKSYIIEASQAGLYETSLAFPSYLLNGIMKTFLRGRLESYHYNINFCPYFNQFDSINYIRIDISWLKPK